MPIGDYAHHNEEAARIWYEEEGRHQDEPPDYDPDFDDDDGGWYSDWEGEEGEDEDE